MKVVTCLFDAAARRYTLKISCRCGHFALFDPHGLWWHFHRRGMDDDFRMVLKKMWCRECARALGRRIRPRAIQLAGVGNRATVIMPLPDEREWKRIINRHRG